MADTKISALTAATTPLAGTEVLPIVQSSTTKKVSVANLTAGRAVSVSTLTENNGNSGAAFNAGISLQNSANGIDVNLPAIVWGDPASFYWGAIACTRGSGIGGGRLKLYDTDGSNNLRNTLNVDRGYTFPGADNVTALGEAGTRWSVVYAATGTINTSDARDKQQVRPLDEAEQAVAKKIKSLIRAFKFNEAVELKGDSARIHVGVVAQDVKAAFESEGLTAEDYGILCFDEWEAEYEDVVKPEETVNQAGETVVQFAPTGEKRLVRAAGNRYGVRYEELLAFMIAAL